MTASSRYNPIMRRAFPALVVLFAVAFSVSAAAQANGVPASIMSYGPGRGMAPGVPASVTSMGPFGYTPQWNIQPLFPTNPGHHPPHPGHHPPHPGRDGNLPLYGGGYYWGGGYYQPVIVAPAQDTSEEAAEDDYRCGPTIFDRRGPRCRDNERREEVVVKDVEPAHARVDAPPPPEPAVQPKTVLIYRDGHKEEVQNYAIVGENLIDFGESRRKIALTALDVPATVKANDERGIDFTLPVSQKAR
jgi:hypothetical protein